MTGATNLFAGMGAHQSARSETDTWFSPPAVLEALGGWQSFDLDPCSPAERPWPTARQHYGLTENGLLLPWFGRVWLNPPYTIALITRFLGRMATHGRGIALIFARTDTAPFHDHVFGAAHALLFLRGRLNFHRADGARAAANGGAPSVLIAYGDEDCQMLCAAPIAGAFVPLRLKTQLLVAAFAPGTTWAGALDAYMAAQAGPVALGALYKAFVDHPKCRSNQHWREKLRQALQRGAYERVDKGLWRRRVAT